MSTGKLDSGMTAKQALVARRRRQVANLLIRRFGRVEIAEALGQSVSTIDKDIAHIRGEFSAEVSRNASVMELAGDLMARSRARERELWAVVQRSMGKKQGDQVIEEEDRMSLVVALRELRANQNDELRSLQSLGLVYKAPQRMKIDMQVMAALAQMSEETLKQLAEAPEGEFARLVEQTLGTVGTEALGKLIPAEIAEVVPDEDEAPEESEPEEADE